MQEQLTRLWALCRKGARFLYWLLLALVLGVGVGAAGAAFHHSIEFVTHLRLTHRWLPALLPLAGYHGLYPEQKFVCSKSRTEWFDQNNP